MSKSKRTLGTAPRRRADKPANAVPFVLGRRAFARVSAVEGITPSLDLEAELLKLEDAELDARSDVLAEKYGRA